MGARIILCDARAVINGPRLYGGTWRRTSRGDGDADRKPAPGASTIRNIGQIDRGYEVDKRLRAVGTIERTEISDEARDSHHRAPAPPAAAE
jgi:hypothetical protein